MRLRTGRKNDNTSGSFMFPEQRSHDIFHQNRKHVESLSSTVKLCVFSDSIFDPPHRKVTISNKHDGKCVLEETCFSRMSSQVWKNLQPSFGLWFSVDWRSRLGYMWLKLLSWPWPKKEAEPKREEERGRRRKRVCGGLFTCTETHRPTYQRLTWGAYRKHTLEYQK